MIPLLHPCKADGQDRFVTRLNYSSECLDVEHDAVLLKSVSGRSLFSCSHGLFEVLGQPDVSMDGDVVVVDPKRKTMERLVRADSPHNTFLVTETCDQYCVMCSQPPKKTHVDRFKEYRIAAILAPPDATIGLSGGEPTLYKNDLFDFISCVNVQRPDLSFHILSNGQHFAADDIEVLASEAFKRVTWGIPLYSHLSHRHDELVAKVGAYDRLMDSFVYLLRAGAHIELRTVIMQQNWPDLPSLSAYISSYLGFCDQWSIMQLENIGFAKNRFDSLYVKHSDDFETLASAIDRVTLFGLPVSLFNMTRCSVPAAYRHYVAPSISDWKRKYPSTCTECNERNQCSGFFAWHPDHLMAVSPV